MNATQTITTTPCRRGLGIFLAMVMISPAFAGMRKGPNKRQTYSLRQKLQLIVLPHVKFENTPVREAFATLQKMSKQWDADGRGINFLLHLSKEEEARTVSLDMHRMPVEDLARYACMSAGLNHRIERSAVTGRGSSATTVEGDGWRRWRQGSRQGNRRGG